MLLPHNGRFARRLSVADLYRGDFAMKMINAAEVMEVVDLHGCGDWGTVEVSLTNNGLRVVLCGEIHVLPVSVLAGKPCETPLFGDSQGFPWVRSLP